MAKVEKKDTKEAKEKKAVTKKAEVKLKVDNAVKPGAKDVYVAMCAHTTMALDGESGELVHTKYEKGDTYTGAEVPPSWLNMNVAQRWAILQSDLDKLSNKELKRKGYSV